MRAPALFTSVEIEAPDGSVQTITRAESGAGGRYSLVVSRQSVTSPAWPLEEGRVVNLLRVLTGARSLNSPDEEASIDNEASRVTIRQADGKVFHMLLSGRTLHFRKFPKPAEESVWLDEGNIVRCAYVKKPGLSPADALARSERWMELMSLPKMEARTRMVENARLPPMLYCSIRTEPSLSTSVTNATWP